jgi:hypothetical protein
MKPNINAITIGAIRKNTAIVVDTTAMVATSVALFLV